MQSKQVRYAQYAVKASYAKSLAPRTYYVWAISRADARQMFLAKFPWLNCITSIEPDDTDTSDRAKYILVKPALMYHKRFADCKTVQELNDLLKEGDSP